MKWNKEWWLVKELNKKRTAKGGLALTESEQHLVTKAYHEALVYDDVWYYP